MPYQATILHNENELFAQLAKGSEVAFTEIFYHYTQRIYHFIFSKTKSDALTEDIIQEVFINLWKKRKSLNEVKNYENYILTMATNKVYDFLRKMASENEMKKYVWKSMQTESNITSEALDLKQSQALINQAINELSPQRKKVFVLSRQQGLSSSEIAEQLNLSPNTVNNHLSEALRSVREYVRRSSTASFSLLMILLGMKL